MEASRQSLLWSSDLERFFWRSVFETSIFLKHSSLKAKISQRKHAVYVIISEVTFETTPLVASLLFTAVLDGDNDLWKKTKGWLNSIDVTVDNICHLSKQSLKTSLWEVVLDAQTDQMKQHFSLCLGLLRSKPIDSQVVQKSRWKYGLNPLGIRHANILLQRR